MRTHNYLALAIALISLAACKKPIEMPVHVTGVSVSPASLTMTEGEEATLVATISPSNADDPTVRWSSSNGTVAKISQEGLVTALSPGQAAITVTTTDGGFESVCNVTVQKAVVPVSGVSLDKSTLEMTVGDEATLVASVLPTDATNQKVSWKSSDTSVASVEDGKVNALSPGSATVSVVSEDGGHTASCTVTVKAKVIPVASVSLDKSALALVVGDKGKLTATVLPEEATDRSVQWSSANPAIASVDEGVVSAVGAGTTSILAKTIDGGFSASCEVTVYPTSKSIKYSTKDGKPIVLIQPEAIGTLVSNTVVDGVGLAVFAEDIVEIGPNAFQSCNTMVSIQLPPTVKAIDSGAFINCSSLSAMNIPVSVTAIGETAFAGCSALERFSGPFATSDGRALIVENALMAVAPAGLDEFTVPSSIVTLGRLVFSGCSGLKAIHLPDGLKEIGVSSFRGCSSLKSIVLPAGITVIPTSVFENCTSLSKVDFPAGLVSIGQYAFYSCRSLTKVVLPATVEVLGDESFRACATLTEADLPAGLARIGNAAFYDCGSLSSVTVRATDPPALGSNAFYGIPVSCSFYVPAGSIDAYRSSAWANNNGRIFPQL